jgi:adenosylcobinamide-GDP ribazoletransferase
VRAFAVAVGFLTRIPVGHSATRPRELARAIVWFPLVGLCLGVLLVLAAAVLDLVVTPSVAAPCVVALMAATTGAIHLDGVADTFDGLAAAHGDRASALEAMRDPRVGAHGVVAVSLVLLLKVAATGAILARGDSTALLAAPALARWVVVLIMLAWAPARPDGMAAMWRTNLRVRDVIITTVTIAPLVALGGRRIAMCGLAARFVGIAIGRGSARRLGGATGDVYGAVIEFAETAAIVVACSTV